MLPYKGSMWKTVTENIVRSDNLWSSKSLKPTQTDIDLILEISDSESAEIFIVRKDKPALVFRNNEFVRTGPFYFDPSYPRWADENDAEYLYWISRLGTFKVEDLARKMYPELYMRGQAYRLKDKPGIWGPTFELLSQAFGADRVEEYDFGGLAKIRTGNFVYSKAQKEGWVGPGKERGQWKKTF